FALVRSVREALDHAGEAFDRRGVAPGVVVALRHPQRGQPRRRARAEVGEQPGVAAARVLVALSLEVDVTGTGPGPLGDRAGGAVAHHRLPAIHRVAGASE